MKNRAVTGASGLAFAALTVLSAGCSGAEVGSESAADEILKPGSYAASPPGVQSVGAVGTAKTSAGQTAVDAEGFTLYVFDKDSTNPPKSACIDDCGDMWVPALASTGMPVAFPGIDSNKLGILVRQDGGKQITLHGSPLYRFEGDKKPGEVRGHAANGPWRAATPNGSPKK
ncbi:hypothetical protein [Streptomyces sp. NPDC088748]|uniref:COG4315 family predicted lipoprotein n=1 Tax=Streptomyces sp. NPDC088748 TaxID=3365887 RepID=UPI00381763A1